MVGEIRIDSLNLPGIDLHERRIFSYQRGQFASQFLSFLPIPGLVKVLKDFFCPITQAGGNLNHGVIKGKGAGQPFKLQGFFTVRPQEKRASAGKGGKEKQIMAALDQAYDTAGDCHAPTGKVDDKKEATDYFFRFVQFSMHGCFCGDSLFGDAVTVTTSLDSGNSL